MRRKIIALLSALMLLFTAFWSFYGSMPREITELEAPKIEFSTHRAFQHVKALAEQPHYVGSAAHNQVKNYLVHELQNMGLLVHTQEDFSLNAYGYFSRPQNIMARIEGTENGKALLLLSHYDSAVHSSYGASDAASGVATILEGVRAFLASGKQPHNDIIILFSDAEEVGLLGAKLFVTQHPWAKEVGLALNFEARGSGGASFMLLETNGGNKNLIKNFVKAHPKFPVTNSLAYSVYKMLPNDTDLTMLRSLGNIPGFNFAFIGDHFDYHTALDVPKNLDKNTLAHQGSYLMPLLNYFANTALTNLKAPQDYIYFNFPVVKMVYYPFSWIFPLVILAGLLFMVLVIYGIIQKKISIKQLLKSFLPLLISLLVSGLLSFSLWKVCLWAYPQYGEIVHNFTYNGYFYIYAVLFLALAVCFFSYAIFNNQKNHRELFVAPLLLWIVICTLAAFYLKGASYLIIPVFFALVQLFLLLKQKKPNLIVLTLLSLPGIAMIFPFAQSFAVALGLQILFFSATLMVFLWVLLWPVFSFYGKKKIFALFCFFVFIFFMVLAHLKSDFNSQRPKPNSLVYLLDFGSQTATWNTYDGILDPWTAPFFEKSLSAPASETQFSSKYGGGFTHSSPAPVIAVNPPSITTQFLGEGDDGNRRFSVKISSNREVDRIDLYTKDKIDFESFTVNGLHAPPVTLQGKPQHIFKDRWSNRLLTYFVASRDTLRLRFSVSGNFPEIVIFESSFNLLENEKLNVPSRSNAMIPRPFVLNDAIVVKKKIFRD